MIVKICGLRTPMDALYANMAAPDMAGMVFHPKSRRCVSIDEARQIRGMLGRTIRSVGVFVDSDPSLMGTLLDEGIIDIVQVHACTDDYFRKARDFGAPVIRAYIVRTKEDVQIAASSEADYILLDAGMGDGKTFDWSLLEDAGFDYILSGGLDNMNVRDAVRRLNPFGVDVSSGVETDGAKDPTKMTSFVYAARGNFEPLLEGEARKGF
ncbi:MAG: phosphoribosylanthranilate isomerase [Thermoplasmata archaeon]|nr:phosphoribosylanthranilate isomerase [Thermoplasmata archaeon]